MTMPRRLGPSSLLAVLLLLPIAPLLAVAAPADDLDDLLVALRQGMHARSAAMRGRAANTMRALAARPLAGEPDLAKRWTLAPSPPYRNRALGPAYKVLTLAQHERLHLEQTFLAGQRAEVAASADPSLAFDLDVALAGTRVGCVDSGKATRCSWVPDHTARYSIDLVSRGRRPSRFYIVRR